MNTFRNFFSTLRRYKTASLLNIVGLTMAFAAFYMIMTQVYWEFTFNCSIPHSERTYVAAATDIFGDENDLMEYIARPAMERTLAASPEVEAAGAVNSWGDEYGRYNEDYVWSAAAASGAPERFTLADESAFSISEGLLDVLPFRAVEGDLHGIARPGTAIISRSEAARLGAGVGSLLYVSQSAPKIPVEVVGIYYDLPDNSLGRNMKILHHIGQMDMDDVSQWNTIYYLRLREGADPDGFVARWTEIDAEVRGVGSVSEGGYAVEPVSFELVPVSEVYFHDRLRMNSFSGSLSVTFTLLGIAVLVIVIALINFINFFFAMMPVRLRAVNLLKVFGASTASLRAGFVTEAVGFVVCALLLAWYLVAMLGGSWLHEYFPESLSLADNVAVAALVAVVALAAIVAASLWPAHYITSFSPVMAAKGYIGSRGGRMLRTSLLAVQFFIAQVLIVVSMVMWMQYRYMMHTDPGFARDGLMVAELPLNLGTQYRGAFSSLLDAEPQIARHAFASRLLPIPSGAWNWRSESADGNGYKSFAVINCDTSLVGVLGVDLIEGRDFTGDDWRKSSGSLIVNDCARRRYELHLNDMPAGDKSSIVGFCRDFHYCSLQYAVDPLIFNLANDPNYWLLYLYLRPTAGADIGKLIRRVSEAAHEACPEVEPDDVHLDFLDSRQSEAYRHERRSASIVTIFGLLAVVIALMGVFGLVLFETHHRRREIAVRKVYGATTREVVAMFNRRYVSITLYCFVAAAPVSWYISSRWLARFAYRMSGAGWLLLAAIAAVLAVTVATVTLRSWRAADADPAESIKTE